MTVPMAMVVPVIMAVPMVRVPMPAQDDKNECIHPNAHQSQDEHHCTSQHMLDSVLSLLCHSCKLTICARTKLESCRCHMMLKLLLLGD